MRHPTSTRARTRGPVAGIVPTVLRLVQSVSRELVLGKLVDRVLAFALEHGADPLWDRVSPWLRSQSGMTCRVSLRELRIMVLVTSWKSTS